MLVQERDRNLDEPEKVAVSPVPYLVYVWPYLVTVTRRQYRQDPAKTTPARASLVSFPLTRGANHTAGLPV
jgi:hypothetical protein